MSNLQGSGHPPLNRAGFAVELGGVFWMGRGGGTMREGGRMFFFCTEIPKGVMAVAAGVSVIKADGRGVSLGTLTESVFIYPILPLESAPKTRGREIDSVKAHTKPHV